MNRLPFQATIATAWLPDAGTRPVRPVNAFDGFPG